MIHATNYELVVIPTLARGLITIGTYLTASEAYAAARLAKDEWPEGSYKLEIREVSGD